MTHLPEPNGSTTIKIHPKINLKAILAIRDVHVCARRSSRPFLLSYYSGTLLFVLVYCVYSLYTTVKMRLYASGCCTVRCVLLYVYCVFLEFSLCTLLWGRAKSTLSRQRGRLLCVVGRIAVGRVVGVADRALVSSDSVVDGLTPSLLSLTQPEPAVLHSASAVQSVTAFDPLRLYPTACSWLAAFSFPSRVVTQPELTVLHSVTAAQMVRL